VRLKENCEAVNRRHTWYQRDRINQLVNVLPSECDDLTIPLGSPVELVGSR
jgi:hypothetical protein